MHTCVKRLSRKWTLEAKGCIHSTLRRKHYLLGSWNRHNYPGPCVCFGLSNSCAHTTVLSLSVPPLVDFSKRRVFFSTNSEPRQPGRGGGNAPQNVKSQRRRGQRIQKQQEQTASQEELLEASAGGRRGGPRIAADPPRHWPWIKHPFSRRERENH